LPNLLNILYSSDIYRKIQIHRKYVIFLKCHSTEVEGNIGIILNTSWKKTETFQAGVEKKKIRVD